MTGIAIRVENPFPEHGRRLGKLYHLDAVPQRHDTSSTLLNTRLKIVSRIAEPAGGRAEIAAGGEIQRFTHSYRRCIMAPLERRRHSLQPENRA